MPTGAVWTKGHRDELAAFEASLNDNGDGAAERLAEASRQMRLPGADFMDVYWRVFFGREPDALSLAIGANWFGRHPTQALANLPMWASNALLSPQEVHALVKEAFARAADWRAAGLTSNQISVWARCGEPEHQAWLLWPTAPAGPGQHTAHLFLATPYNAAYPRDFTGPDPDGRPEPTPQDRVAARELLDALVQLSALRPGDSLAAHLGAADRVAVARTALPGADGTDDNQLFGALCRALTDQSDVGDPPFKGTGLAVRMGADDAEVSGVTATPINLLEPPGGDAYRTEELDRVWGDGLHDGVHLRYQP